MRKEAAEAVRLQVSKIATLEVTRTKLADSLACVQTESAALRERLVASEQRAGDYQALAFSRAADIASASKAPVRGRGGSRLRRVVPKASALARR